MVAFCIVKVSCEALVSALKILILRTVALVNGNTFIEPMLTVPVSAESNADSIIFLTLTWTGGRRKAKNRSELMKIRAKMVQIIT